MIGRVAQSQAFGAMKKNVPGYVAGEFRPKCKKTQSLERRLISSLEGISKESASKAYEVKKAGQTHKELAELRKALKGNSASAKATYKR
jgi:hypothetical protein